VAQLTQAPTNHQPLSIQLTVAALGALLSVIAHYFLPKSPGQSFFESVSALQVNGSQFAWMYFIVNYFMKVALLCIAVLAAAYLRGPRAWIFAFLSGAAVPELFIFQWLK
jgi:hypothetical protein